MLSGCIKVLTNVSDFDVPCIYELCTLFVFPSWYEGFGRPILEAMAARRVMVLSDIPVFREITENKGIYFPPENVEAMALAIEKVLNSESERARLVTYGDRRVMAFTFASVAGQVECLYRSLI